VVEAASPAPLLMVLNKADLPGSRSVDAVTSLLEAELCVMACLNSRASGLVAVPPSSTPTPYLANTPHHTTLHDTLRRHATTPRFDHPPHPPTPAENG
jgi:signal recognition particle receptor subunit beta